MWSCLIPERRPRQADPWAAAFVPAFGVLASYLLAFRRVRMILGAIGAAGLFLLAAELVRLDLITHQPTSHVLSLVLWNGLASGLIVMTFSTVVLLWLRLWGFRLDRLEPARRT